MKKLVLAALLSAFACAAHADLVTHYLKLDTAKQDQAFETTITRGSTPLFRIQVMNNNIAVTNLSEYGIYLYYATNATASSGVRVQGSTTNNNTNGYAYIQFTSDQALGIYSNASEYPATFWCQVVVITNSTGKAYDWSQGRIRIRSGGAIEGAATVVLNGAESDPVFSAWLNTGSVTTVESDPVFTNWITDASALTLKLGGTTNVLTDDGTNLLRNGVLIAGSGGSGSGFPATNDMNAAGYDLTNAATIQASAFKGGTFNGTTIAGTTFSGQNMTLSGTLVVNTISNQHTTYQSATVNLGTNYITNTYTTANYTTNYVYANIVTTEINYVTNYSEQQTIVNVGGYMDVSYADWVALPHLTDSNDVVTASGTWDFTGAMVSGIVAGSTVTNIGFGLTGDGDETALAVDTSIVATGTPLYAYTETDPVFVSWRENDFTGAVESLVESIAVTGAVTSINGRDGAVTLTIDGAGVTTNSATSWTIAAGTGTTSSTRATWIEMGAPPANWAISDTNGAAQVWRLGNAVTNIYAGSGTTNHIEAFTLKVYPGTNSISVGAATWATSSADFTNDYSLIDALIDGTNVDLFLLREGYE